MLFLETEMIMQTIGKMKPNLSKHDYVFGASKISIDILFSGIIITITVVCIIWCIAGAAEGGDGPDDCCCFNAHNVDSIHCNGHWDCDCCFGRNDRREYTTYQDYLFQHKKQDDVVDMRAGLRE